MEAAAGYPDEVQLKAEAEEGGMSHFLRHVAHRAGSTGYSLAMHWRQAVVLWYADRIVRLARLGRRRCARVA